VCVAPTPIVFQTKKALPTYATAIMAMQGMAELVNVGIGYRHCSLLLTLKTSLAASSESVEENLASTGTKLLIGRGMSIIQRSTKMDVPGKQLLVVPHQVCLKVIF
jgi:hypothetical protein